MSTLQHPNSSQNSSQNQPDINEVRRRAALAVAILNNETFRKIEEAMATGPFTNEVGIYWDPPLVDLGNGLIVATERMRLL